MLKSSAQTGHALFQISRLMPNNALQPAAAGEFDACTTVVILRNRMGNKEATARIKINKLLETAGWRFFPEGSAPANIRLEPGVTIKSSDLDTLGENFEKTSKGFIDFLLLDTKGFPLIVLEAIGGQESARRQGAGPH